MANAPLLIKPIPPQIVHEGAAWGPFDLKEYIQSPSENDGVVRFFAEVKNGDALPAGVICTSNGLLSGIPAAHTEGQYELLVTAENAAETPFTTSVMLTIRARIEILNHFSDLKTRIWEALGNDLPLPDMESLLNRPITELEIYYLLQRYASLTIWDVYNLDAPGEKILLELPGVSPHYAIYDRGCCLVATPKDLFTYERTLEDALQTARVLAREVYTRNWVIEFAGFDKMTRAAWVELQHLADVHGRDLEILHYTPSEEDQKIYAAEVRNARKMSNL